MRIRSSLILNLIGSGLFAIILAAAPADPSTKPTTQVAAAEGLVIEQESTTNTPGAPASPQRMVIKFKGARMRMDIGTAMSSITFADGHGATLMHANHICMITSASQRKAGLDVALSNVDPAEQTKAVATGRTMTIRGIDTEAYTFDRRMMGQSFKVTYWIAAKYPDAERLMAKYQELEKALKASSFPMGIPSSLPSGMPVRIENEQANGIKMCTDVLSIKVAPIDDSDFEIPKGYQQQSMPVSPTGR